MNAAPEGAAPSSRRRLEASAELVRERLTRHLDELHARKTALLHPLDVARRHPRQLIVLGVALGLLVGTGVALAGYRAATRAERLRHARLSAWWRLATRPEELGAPRRSTLATVAEKGATAAVSAAVAALVKHYAAKALAE